MKIKPIKDAILLASDARITMFIWGHKGTGKSSIVEQVCMDNNMGYINLRCSQIEASDIRGLPDKVDGRTVFLPPADLPIGGISWEQYIEEIYPTDPKHEFYWNPDKQSDDPHAFKRRGLAAKAQPRLNKGILFLDEINRAQDDVLQAVFELVLDYKVGTYVIPDGWSIICAGNFQDGDYITNGFNDAAFLDRFSHVILDHGESTASEWVEYMSKTHGEEAAQVIEFASQNVIHLDGEPKGQLGFTITPSRRSWESVVKIEKIYRKDPDRYSEVAKFGLISGLVGTEMAISYDKYDCPVKPAEVISSGVSALRDKLMNLSRNQLIGLMFGLANKLKPTIDKEKSAKIALDFARHVCEDQDDKDLVVAFLKFLMHSNNTNHITDKIRSAIISNPRVTQLMNKVMQGRTNKFYSYLAKDKELNELIATTTFGKEDD